MAISVSHGTITKRYHGSQICRAICVRRIAGDPIGVALLDSAICETTGAELPIIDVQPSPKQDDHNRYPRPKWEFSRGHRHGQINVSGRCKFGSLFDKLCHPEPDWLQHSCGSPRKVCSDSERRGHGGRSCCTIFHWTRKPVRSEPCGGIREPIQKNVLGRAVPSRQGSLVEPMVAVVIAQ